MKKYRIGQKVRILRTSSGHEFDPNEEVEITKQIIKGYIATNGINTWVVDNNDIISIDTFITKEDTIETKLKRVEIERNILGIIAIILIIFILII